MAVFKLHNYPQAHQMILDLMPRIKARLQAGNVLTLTITEDNRSLDQNAMFHALIGQIAKQAKAAGSQFDEDDFKKLLVFQWSKETGKKASRIVPSLDGGSIVQLGLQTHKFTKAEASEFTEWLIAWATTNGFDVV